MDFHFFKRLAGTIEAPEQDAKEETRQLTKAEIADQEKFWAGRKAEIAKARANIPTAKDLKELKGLISTIGEMKDGTSSTAVNFIIDRTVESVDWANELNEAEPLLALENITATDGIRERVTQLIVELIAKEFPNGPGTPEQTVAPSNPLVMAKIDRLRAQLSAKQLEYLNLYQKNKSRAVIQTFQPKLSEEIRKISDQISTLIANNTPKNMAR